MILAKLLGLIGLAAPHVPEDHIVERAMRHAKAASWQHGRINENEQSAALDRIEKHVADLQSDEISKGAETLKETVRTMLGKLS